MLVELMEGLYDATCEHGHPGVIAARCLLSAVFRGAAYFSLTNISHVYASCKIPWKTSKR
jgi:hypothetical protein